MKKMMKLLTMAGIALIAVTFVACDDNKPDDGHEDPVEEEGTVYEQVNPIDEEVKEYLDANVQLIVASAFNDKGWKERLVDKCVMINSTNELREIANITETVELPHIDFDAHTLIIGKYIKVDTAVYYISQNLVAGSKKITVNVVVGTDLTGGALIDVEPFWGLYPKLPQLPITVVRDNYL